MDDGVFASRSMTDEIIKRAELESTRKDGRKDTTADEPQKTKCAAV